MQHIHTTLLTLYIGIFLSVQQKNIYIGHVDCRMPKCFYVYKQRTYIPGMCLKICGIFIALQLWQLRLQLNKDHSKED